jgi:MFS family permease
MTSTSNERTPVTPSPDEPLGNVADASNAPSSPQNSRGARRGSAWQVLRHRDYSLLFWGQLISAAGTQIQVVAVAWQVYQLTNSAVALGIIGLVQAIPRLIFSLVGGVVADAYDRRRLLILVNTIMASLSAILAITTWMGSINVGIIYAIVLLAAIASSFEFPTRQAIIPTLVPREQMADALSISMVLMQLTFVVGSAAGGFVIAWLGLANTYWLDVISYFVVLGSLFIMVVPRVPADKRAQAGIGALVDGMRFLHAHPIILAVLSLDFFATFFGSPRALLPVYSVSILHTGAVGLGILQAATSIGAVALAPLTGRIGRIRRQGLGVAVAIIGWGVCIIAFGFSAGPLLLSALFLAGAGAADMVSMVLRGLIVQMTTPDEFRGRISAVNAMFVIGGPMLGQFESGLVAGLTNPVFSVVSGGVACIVATLAVVALAPGLLQVRVK